MHEENTNIQHCPVCGSGRIHYAFTKHGYALNECDKCSFLFFNPQPSDEVLAQIYDADYFLSCDSDRPAESRTELKKGTAELYLDTLKKYAGPLTGRLLEIGCGQGEFLTLAREAGFEVTGVEFSMDAVERANKKLGDKCVRCGTLEEQKFQDYAFDVIVLFDVIEHVRRPLETLHEIKRLIKPDGVIFLVTPSLDSWSASLMKNEWVEFKIEHLSYFNTRTMELALHKAGFADTEISPNYKVLRMDYINSHFQAHPVPIYTQAVAGLNAALPRFLRRKKFKVVASGMNVLARSRSIHKTEKLSVVLPVFNEIKTFSTLMDRLAAKKVPGVDKEIIIVESNSTDGTREAVQRYEGYPGVRVIYEDRPQGKGHAVRTGLAAVTGDVVLIQDADLEYDIDDYDVLIKPFIEGPARFVLGSRHTENTGWKIREFEKNKATAFVMNVAHGFFTLMFNLLYGTRIKDPTTMYKVFRTECLDGITFECNRFDLDWEIVAKLVRAGHIPREIPINYRSRSYSEGKKVRFFRDPLTWIRAIIKYRLQ